MAHLDRSLIAGLPPFARLDSEELDRILHRARSERAAKGSAVFQEGQPAERFYLLLSGHLRVVRTSPDGAQMVARVINPGELFGIAIAMGRPVFPASAVAVVDCVVLSWPNTEWPVLRDSFPAFAEAAYQTIGNRLVETQSKAMELATEHVEKRIAATLLQLAGQAGRKTGEGLEIDFPLSRQDIADMTGTTLYTVSRILSLWESQGIIAGGRQKVVVVDPRRLMHVGEPRSDAASGHLP